MLKWLIPLGIMLLGLVISCSGLVYGSLTVGVPTPDAVGEVKAQEMRDTGLSFWLMDVGFFVVGVGGLGMIVVLIRRGRPSK